MAYLLYGYAFGMSRIFFFTYLMHLACLIQYKNQKKNYSPFLWTGFICLKATEPLRGDGLLFGLRLVYI